MTESMLIFSTGNRDEAHRVLEYVRDEAKKLDRLDENGIDREFPGAEKFDAQFHPDAECREDASQLTPYQVWTGPAYRPPAEASSPAPVLLQGIDLDALATLIAQKLKKGE